jgi:hypothetical protein
MKIIINPADSVATRIIPARPGERLMVDPGVGDVVITKAFLGVGFLTGDGEHLGVSMRDHGFEFLYHPEGVDGPEQHWEFKNGMVKRLDGSGSADADYRNADGSLQAGALAAMMAEIDRLRAQGRLADLIWGKRGVPTAEPGPVSIGGFPVDVTDTPPPVTGFTTVEDVPTGDQRVWKRLGTIDKIERDGDGITVTGTVDPAPDPVIDERLLRTTDKADVWAREFAKVFPDVDEGTMIAWFANCAENAKDLAFATQAAELPEINEFGMQLTDRIDRLAAGLAEVARGGNEMSQAHSARLTEFGTELTERIDAQAEQIARLQEVHIPATARLDALMKTIDGEAADRRRVDRVLHDRIDSQAERVTKHNETLMERVARLEVAREEGVVIPPPLTTAESTPVPPWPQADSPEHPAAGDVYRFRNGLDLFTLTEELVQSNGCWYAAGPGDTNPAVVPADMLRVLPDAADGTFREPQAAPWVPSLDDNLDARGRVTQAVQQAIGSGSMAWEHVDRAGVFDSTEALRIADGLLAWIFDVESI